MTCTDVRRVLPEMDDSGQNAEFEAHLESCPACSELVSDLELIASEARQLAESEEPAPRVWVRIAADLRAEGLIREPEMAPMPAVLVPRSRRWNAWWLTPIAAVMLLAAGVYVVSHRPEPQQATQTQTQSTQPQPQVAEKTRGNQPAPQVSEKLPVVKPALTGAKNAPAQEESASLDDQQILQEVSTSAPSMRTTYANQLKAVNSYIRDAEAYLKQNPGDEEARQQLMNAYEQKALLYQMALDHVQ